MDVISSDKAIYTNSNNKGDDYNGEGNAIGINSDKDGSIFDWGYERNKAKHYQAGIGVGEMSEIHVFCPTSLIWIWNSQNNGVEERAQKLEKDHNWHWKNSNESYHTSQAIWTEVLIDF